ncbi:bifunctional enoyl-CoA hydratase/phosphate acetyltransferase [Bacillus shivajii]|uniref:bifunctional enoyl-CoA hydratase/phosphate acetyltransferase n=1 Tax=Bacillus shivajii TaxID=1983719 RepID=UPI001CFA380B|nr:bifunctional enoyl-CoA hydratase/phosphate acetyltransferase [Bacillus shivajii]UCZ54623.1 bifunctional enoyl-CoA hydratase/phosphate acetyltransferase [Bacillus shivajii]
MTLEELLATVSKLENKQTIAVAHATDSSVFQAAKKAMNDNIASFIFVGPIEEMKTAMENVFNEDDQQHFQLEDAANDKDAAMKAVDKVRSGDADALMKGMVGTSTLLKAVLNKEKGLRSGKILSHVAGFALPNRDKLLFLADAAMNIHPTLQEKQQIIENTVDAARRIGVETPKVAALAAVENVNPAMEATMDAAALTQMNRRGQIKGCIIDGPLAFDIAVSEKAATQKGIDSEVAGRADVLMVPTIEVGNALYKSFTIFGQAEVGGMIVGAKAPIILTSRADSVESKLLSMAMAVSTSAKK